VLVPILGKVKKNNTATQGEKFSHFDRKANKKRKTKSHLNHGGWECFFQEEHHDDPGGWNGRVEKKPKQLSVGHFESGRVCVGGPVVQQHASHDSASAQPTEQGNRVVEQNHRQPDQKSSFCSVSHTETQQPNN
jgi:hypothetical protein